MIGGIVYQGNDTNVNTTLQVGLGDFPLLLGLDDTLFVNPAGGNFYLDEGSDAIDSSVDSLDDRPEIDSLVGVFGREEITKVADRLIGDLDEQRSVFNPAPIRALRPPRPRRSSSPVATRSHLDRHTFRTRYLLSRTVHL